MRVPAGSCGKIRTLAGFRWGGTLRQTYVTQRLTAASNACEKVRNPAPTANNPTSSAWSRSPVQGITEDASSIPICGIEPASAICQVNRTGLAILGLRTWLRDRARLGPDERINFRDVVNIVSGLALGQRFADISPEYPTFSVLVTEANRKQLVGNALRALTGGTRTKDASAILDALELLDGASEPRIASRGGLARKGPSTYRKLA